MHKDNKSGKRTLPRKEPAGADSGRNSAQGGQKLRVIKGKKKKNRRFALLRAVISTAVLLFLIIAVVYVNSLSPGGIVEWTQTTWEKSGSGDGFPQTVSERNISSIHAQSGDTAVFTDTSLIFYNKNGKEIRTVLHGYTSPAICATKTRTLVYDRGAMTFRVDNVDRTLYEKKTDSAIITADMADNGTFALVTASDSYSAQITVYSKDFYQKSTRNISGGDVTSVSVSRDGKYIFTVTVTAADGYYRSTVSKYDMKSSDAVSKASFDGVLIFSAKQAGNNIFLVGGTKLICVNEKLETLNEISYGGCRLSGYNVSRYGAALILEQSDFSSEIAAFSADGSETARRRCDYSAASVLRAKGCTYVLKSGLAECFDDLGNIINTYDTVGDAAFLAEGGRGKIAAASLSELDMISVKQ